MYAKLVCMLMLLLRQYKKPGVPSVRKTIELGTGKACYS